MFRRKPKFYKVISVLSVLLFLIVFYPQPTSAQVNYCLTGTPSFNRISLRGSGISWRGNSANLNDDNLSTYIGYGETVTSPSGTYRGIFEGIVTFAATAPQITHVYYDLEGAIPGMRTVSCNITTSLLIGGSWVNIDSRSDTAGYRAALRGVDIFGTWNNVDAVKVYVMIEPIVWRCTSTCSYYAHLTEIRAFGPAAPIVSTNSAADITETSATLNGNITNTGGQNALERGFDWGTSPGVYTDGWTESGSYGTGAFSRGITGLAASTTYYFRAKARNSAGWGYGLEQSFPTNSVLPCQNHEVWGWAWSENIGWISFSCQNTMAIGTGIDYGVDIDEVNSRLSGYAWSEYIGWISFNSADLVGCPSGSSGTCAANINMTTGALSGWARAIAPIDRPLSETGGWDGWIKLSGTAQDLSVYGPVLRLAVGPPAEYQDWVWGGDPDNDNNQAVIGYVSFNTANVAGGADYAVYTDFSVNTGPTAAISCTLAACSVYHPTQILVLNNDSTDPENNIAQSQWSTKVQGAADSTYVVRDTCLASPLCNFTPQNWFAALGGFGNYTVRLIVTDAGGLSNTAVRNFSILRDISAGFMCSLNELGPWENCENMTIAPLEGEIVWFFDDSGLVQYSEASQGASINSRTWQKIGEATPFSVGNVQKTSIAASLPSMDIRLTVEDTAGRRISTTRTIGVQILPLPTWNEIAPF